MPDELDIIRAAVDGVTNACKRITVSGARPRTIGVELSIEPTPALVERITTAIADAVRPDLATGCTCVRKVKAKREKTMKDPVRELGELIEQAGGRLTVKRPRAVTVDGDRITKALRTIRGAHLMIAEELETLLAELARGKVSKEVPAMLDDAPQNGAAVERPRVRPIENGTAAAGARTLSPAGGVQTYLGELSQRALITREHGRSQLTLDGAREVGDPLPPKPTKRALLDRWLAEFGNDGPGQILRAIADAGRPLTPSELLDLVPYKATSIQTYLGELSTPHVIKRGGGRAWLHPELGGPS